MSTGAASPLLPCSVDDDDNDDDISTIASSEAASPRTLYARTFDRGITTPSSRRSPGVAVSQTPPPANDDFASLPLAVRRKYFSPLERLRLANSNTPIMSQLAIPPPTGRPSLLERRVLTAPDAISRPKPLPRTLREHVRQRTLSTNETSWFLTRPEKPARKRSSYGSPRGQKAAHPPSIVLDAADEAFLRTTRRKSYKQSPTRKMAERQRIEAGPNAESTMNASIYDDNFRWMEDTELDLRLAPFDNYHANLDGVVIPSSTSTRRPSFRRQMSVSGLPFGRISSASPPQSPRTDSPPSTQSQQRSRAMSLILPRHSPDASMASVEPNTAHYQDPEARMKLRVYLASPQKFDEAIEFGFPSLDEQLATENKENKPPARQSRDRTRPTALTSPRTFFDDMQDAESMFFDDKSDVESEAPRTPLETEFGYPHPHARKTSQLSQARHKTSEDYSHLGLKRPTIVKVQDGYGQASHREMTLRMTLTRPDLRADESAIYGMSKTPLQTVPLSWDLEEKEDLKGPLGGHDGWGLPDRDGVVRRLWHKVRLSSQRKSS